MIDKKYKGIEIYRPQIDEAKENYRNWKKTRSANKTPFFMLYKDFQEAHLKAISGGAMKLYIYLGFNTNNFTGECWISIDQIADYFGNDKRTVKGWFAELEKQKLILRIQTGYKRVANTFLLPYGDDSVD